MIGEKRGTTLMATTKETMIAKYGGEEGYRAHMREIRAKVDMAKHSGGAFNNKKFASKQGKRGMSVRWRQPDQDSATGVSTEQKEQ